MDTEWSDIYFYGKISRGTKYRQIKGYFKVKVDRRHSTRNQGHSRVTVNCSEFREWELRTCDREMEENRSAVVRNISTLR